MAAMMSFYAEKCCCLGTAHTVSTWHLLQQCLLVSGLHIRLLHLAAEAGYINTNYIKFKIKQNTQISSQKSSEISVRKLRRAYKTKDFLNLSVCESWIEYYDGFLSLDNILSSHPVVNANECIFQLYGTWDNRCNRLTSIICLWLDASWLNLDSSKVNLLICTARSSRARLQSAANVVLCLSNEAAVCNASSALRFNVMINCDCSSIRDRSKALSEHSSSDNPRWVNRLSVFGKWLPKTSYK